MGFWGFAMSGKSPWLFCKITDLEEVEEDEVGSDVLKWAWLKNYWAFHFVCGPPYLDTNWAFILVK